MQDHSSLCIVLCLSWPLRCEPHNSYKAFWEHESLWSSAICEKCLQQLYFRTWLSPRIVKVCNSTLLILLISSACFSVTTAPGTRRQCRVLPILWLVENIGVEWGLWGTGCDVVSRLRSWEDTVITERDCVGEKRLRSKVRQRSPRCDRCRGLACTFVSKRCSREQTVLLD